MDKAYLEKLALRESQERQVLKYTLGAVRDLTDVGVNVKKVLYREENWRWSSEQGLQVGIPQNDGPHYFSRAMPKELKERLSKRDQRGKGRPHEKIEYVWLLAQCLHYRLQFPLTRQDGITNIASAILKEQLRRPKELKLLSQKLKEETSSKESLEAAKIRREGVSSLVNRSRVGDVAKRRGPEALSDQLSAQPIDNQVWKKSKSRTKSARSRVEKPVRKPKLNEANATFGNIMVEEGTGEAESATTLRTDYVAVITPVLPDVAKGKQKATTLSSDDEKEGDWETCDYNEHDINQDQTEKNMMPPFTLVSKVLALPDANKIQPLAAFSFNGAGRLLPLDPLQMPQKSVARADNQTTSSSSIRLSIKIAHQKERRHRHQKRIREI